MTTPSQIQALLRFLSQDSKLPLALAITKAKSLQKANLLTPDDILKKDLASLHSVLGEEQVAKQVLNAARRAKKRVHEADSTGSPVKKSKKTSLTSETSSPSLLESALTLPLSSNIEEISSVVLITNRAPLVLAFAVVLLKYTMPEQPLSSRLSLAQAVVSANSRSKAISLGIETGKSAEDEGWAGRQPTVKVLGREIPVLKRWGYNWQEESPSEQTTEIASIVEKSEKENSENHRLGGSDEQPALWGLYPEALKRSNANTPGPCQISSVLPIHNPEPAREYLLRSFTLQKSADPSSGKAKKKPSSDSISEKEKSLALLLGAIDLLCQSWASVLSKSEMDRRAWSWYVDVRPDVQHGVGGWGQKGVVQLSRILDLRRKG
ncbi:hypothetical protein, variant [Blastomyces dermatitidis ER-3]|uniref:Impact N-terminal domain-containing protein n=3 Tax=Blastomyces TaxID=229219 RepID=A0A179UV63_BLAGS|nr:uncharacterized protein BDBG_07419 [Blastomyces gilchristii SLH14081]XP_045271950.1 uncharacterized protein BDCG_00646 [Blastomyces dermatitidis ER-3]XP_045279242.1 hypothetical protein, variant [Blastomyces dermatitidis ER-3]EGE80175.1 hypothetical protein BDDG_03116 [Blastomyces dermatitidis ATCC 18188]EQL37325.1 hypothetical protein BDFG_01295 [Blastomyces dermatitidis ATCC 26199]EEQ83841.1 hypothetical protein BDCG_00646 [Blastomyces dermatitidis ER-3]EQL37326.1 hypothetical protein, v